MSEPEIHELRKRENYVPIEPVWVARVLNAYERARKDSGQRRENADL